MRLGGTEPKHLSMRVTVKGSAFVEGMLSEAIGEFWIDRPLFNAHDDGRRYVTCDLVCNLGHVATDENVSSLVYSALRCAADVLPKFVIDAELHEIRIETRAAFSLERILGRRVARGSVR